MEGINSGELFYRSQSGDASSWLLTKLGPKLREFLDDGLDEQAIKDRYLVRSEELKESEALCSRCRKGRAKGLREKIIEANTLCKTYLARARLTNEETVNTMIDLMNEFDSHIAKYALWYYSTLERERSIFGRRLEEELSSCNSLTQHLKSSLRFNIFAIHLESETDRQVLLKRLPASHPQHIRCRRAASENLKPGFFDGIPSFSGINVLDVYKVENKPLLDRFQKCAALMEPGKVKGLFTSVPAKSVERTVVLGFGNSPTATTEGDDDDEQSVSNISGGAAAAKSSVFRRAWYAFHDKGDGYAETIVDSADVAKFPRSFSRYSTVEVDRSFVNDAHREIVDHSLNLSLETQFKAAKATWEKTTDGGGPVSEEIRYLVLCRVVIGKVFVTSKEYRGFPTVGNNPAFDSMYNPLQEEYLVLRPEQVLPEFVIQYNYNRESGSVSAAQSSNPILPVDLSTASIQVPETVWDIELSSPSSTVKGDSQKDQKSDRDERQHRVVPVHSTTTPIRLGHMPLDRTTAEDYSLAPNDQTGGPMIDPYLAAAKLNKKSLEVSRRESLTSWEQLRLNAARQRETILDASDGLHAAFKRKVTQTRHWESARLRETFLSAPELESVQSLKHDIDRAEKDLMRQVARRREMENEMNAMRKKRGGRPLPGSTRR